MKVKVLQVTTVPATLRAFLLPFAEFFRGMGWRVDAMANGITQCSTCQEAFDHTWEIRWSRNPLDPRNLLLAPRQIRALVANEHYDLVHVHTPVAAFVTRYALSRLPQQCRPKVVYTAHGFHFYRGNSFVKNAVFVAAEKLAGRWTDYLVVINREDELAAQRYRLVPVQRIRYMSGIGVDVEKYSPETVSPDDISRVRASMGLNGTDRLFIMVAEFSKGKRHADVLRAFAKLNRGSTHLALAGVGLVQDEMKELARNLGIEDRVHFLGFRTDIPVLLGASVATLLPSEREGLPRCIMESLCAAVPVIGSDIRGVRDLLATGGGRLVRVGDVEGISDSMAWVLDHPTEAQEAGLLGREKMKDYDIRRILADYLELYSEALHTGDL